MVKNTTCQWCGKSYYARPNKIKKGITRFCSISCSVTSRAKGARFNGFPIRINKDGYESVALRIPGEKTRHAMVHVLVAERAIGKKLPSGAVVHHVDRNKTNNSPDNLVILQNASEHAKLHARIKISEK